MPRTTEQSKSATERLQEGFAPGAPNPDLDLDEVDTAAPLEQRADGNGAPLVPVLTGESGRLLVAEATTLARLAEQDHFDDLAAADRLHIGGLKELLAEAIEQRDGKDARQLVGVELVGRVVGAARQWAAAYGLNGHEGGGS